MAKGNPLQEQLLKAGLVKKSKLAEVAREQHQARRAGAAAEPSEARRLAERARIEKPNATACSPPSATRTRAPRSFAPRRGRSSRTRKRRARARANTVSTVDGAIRTLLVDDDQRRKLASGALVIVRHGDAYALLPRAAADKVRDRAAELIVLDHGAGKDADPAAGESDDDAYYAQFEVPDDLVW
jgi:uncharacterized protein YaiL (DUF2058 family)